MKTVAGKGSRPRPTDGAKYREGHDLIWGKRKPKPLSPSHAEWRCHVCKCMNEWRWKKCFMCETRRGKL